MLPIATAEDVGGIKVGDGLQAGPDGTLSVTGGPLSEADHFSVYFTDSIYGIDITWIATTTCSISAGKNPGVAILETGPGAKIEMDICYLDNQTNYDSGATVGTVSFEKDSTVGAISFSKEVLLQPGNVLRLKSPNPADQTAKGLRLVILASKTS